MLFKQQSCGSVLHNYVCINVLRANTAFLLLVLPYKYTPLQEKWSNALRFDPTDTEGKCLHFTASTAGTLFVIFAALPKEPESRYLVEISPEGVYIYKVKLKMFL